ncbi:PucR family transcriptional regulator [Lysinibacillus sp. UBA5990]|uniref:PucR family transcriptional regulator n=1 Tax=Lysinibacillus sp. UBA5990 TaxID=1946773 RepID=UPI000E8FAA98|nr:helix-turn-helix domain-containing protein [Lysinibacillus sp. UBA5990]HBJ00535.1 hypothetical protein [Lysinibacillus sp.]
MNLNLKALFPSYRYFRSKPTQLSHDSHIFYHHETKEWFSISKHEVSQRDYEWLTVFYTEVTSSLVQASDLWYEFIYSNGDIPSKLTFNKARVIQITFINENPPLEALKEALYNFFQEDTVFLQVAKNQFLLIEPEKHSIREKEDFIALIRTIEADFYVRIHLYLGEFYAINQDFSVKFQREAQWFKECLHLRFAEPYYSFQTIFPILLTEQLPTSILKFIEEQIIIPLRSDKELLETVKTFCECGFNISMTSKKLHMHRNTLTYRLSKFQEITNIHIKNLDGVILVYFASYLWSFLQNAQK